MLGQFLGNLNPVDDHLSEEWLASSKATCNNSNPEEGLSRVIDASDNKTILFRDLLNINAETILGPDHTQTFGRSTMLDVRMTDTAEHLPVRYSTTEGEILNILGTRDIEGYPAHMLLGCKAEILPGEFSDSVCFGSRCNLQQVMHEVKYKPGEIFYIPPSTPYSIGAGSFVLRVSNTNDVNRAPEIPHTTCATEGTTPENLARLINPREMLVHRSDTGVMAQATGSCLARSFTFQRAELSGQMDISLEREFAIIMCVAGRGRMTWGGGKRDLHAGDYFLQPFGVPWISYTPSENEKLCLVLALPPQP